MYSLTGLLSVGLSVAVVASGSLALWAITNGGQEAEGDPALPPPIAVTPTPALLEPAWPIEDAEAELAAAHPAADSTIRAALQADVSGLLKAFPVVEGPCEDLSGGRGVTRCELEGLAPGTTITLYALVSETLPGFLVNEQTARDRVGYLFHERNPRLDLLARRDDGAYLAVIGIDPQPDRNFPGGEISGGDVSTVWMVLDESGTVLNFGGRNVNAPALEPIQNDIRHGIHTYEILGVSNEFIAHDSRIHDELEEIRKQPPPP